MQTFYHDLSAEVVSFKTQLYQVEAKTKDNFSCLWSIFGLGWGYGVRKAKVTKSGGMSNLALYEKINVIDFFSD